ncbi:Tyrosine-protein kinase [hydrothermal vent metagenome]|uniref:Tyrosine-protein kinase n=1 Tax=hydrothermal vent metagenome TaxID=652676 RepID=A0A3B0W838_9ZZZZ
MEEEQQKDIQDYIIAIRKRKAAIFSIFTVILTLTVAVGFLLPAIYKSSSTILIEQQEIPQELVMSTVTSFAAERIQTIQARVMTRTNLLRIIDKFNLYQDERKFETTEELMERIRDDISLDVISADVVDPRTGRPSVATIAFSLSYRGESPTKVQRVANELTTLYLDENLNSRTQKAAETSDFFKEETERLSIRIDDFEKKIAVFKQEYANALPELQTLNLGVMQRKESELTSIDTNLRTLEERQFYLSGQLAQLDPGNPAVPGSAERLKQLKSEYASARSKYSSEHPDIIRLKSEIASLESEIGGSDNLDAIAEELKLLTGELAQKRRKYTAEHPDITSLEGKIDALNKELIEAKNSPSASYYEEQPDNPIYITIQSQLASVESEINSLNKQKTLVIKKISEIEEALYEAPQVERDYLILKRDYEHSVLRYQQTKTKQMQADVAKQLELESKGEKFTLIDPAALPEKPVSPNRPAIIFLGLILAIGGGLGFAIVADVISGTIRGARSIQSILGALPLAIIPYEMNLQDKVKTKRIKKRIVVLFIAVIVSALLFIHFVVSPLDVLWFRILRKIDILMA